ncbi:sensor histidine kinase [Paenibacillus hexagrammi]|uniref:Cache domain-containing protein n=1 Tax=Paenibacillus hexagrammi TaxID=2908839 RepID=A0ABY3SLR4_9BACL|nr:cache domain-containing protein [Paenibacillus sp. YPD9-1]UJF34994.1 cache domain-containing protein [Paenibacillus sp. YPD9-1]
MNNSTSEYDRIQSRQRLVDKLVQYINTESYIVSADLIDMQGDQYSSGNLITLSAARQHQVLEAADTEAGSLGWVFPDEEDSSLIASRQIRSYNNLDMQELGVLILRVNLEKIVESHAGEAITRDGEMLIMAGNKVVFPRNVSLNPAIYQLDFSTKKGFRIVNQDGSNYFVSHFHSDYMDWTYFNTIPFQTIFHNIILMKNAMIAAFVISFLLVAGFGMAMARSITRPIEILIANMKGLQIGDLENSEYQLKTPPGYTNGRSRTSIPKLQNDACADSRADQRKLHEAAGYP